MLPLPLFTFRNLAAANLVTVFVYGSLTLGPLAIAIYTREIGGYSAIAADQTHRPERHRIRPRARGECRTTRPGRVVRRAVDNHPLAGCQPAPCDIAALCRDRSGVQPALASSPRSRKNHPLRSNRSRDRRNARQPTPASTALSVHAYPFTLWFTAAHCSPG